MRRKELVFFALATALCFFGCREKTAPDVLRIGIEGNPATLDPRYATDAYSTRILPLVFDRLFEIGDDGAVIGGLAQSWEERDGVLYTIRLRDGVRFSDGTPLRAKDVKANLDFLRDPKNACPAGSDFGVISEVAAPDDRTVVLTLARPFAPILTKLVRAILPRDRLRDADFADHPVGSGPYKVAKMARGSLVELERNENYHGARPNIPRIRFEVLPNETTRMLKMRKGELDLLLNCTPPYALAKFALEKGLAVDRVPGINYSYLGFNLDDPAGVVSKKEVRQAIACALDRRQIIETLLAGQAREANSLLAPENWAYTPDAPNYSRDTARAAALLDAAGFPDPDGAGPKPRFKLSFKTSTDRLRNRIALALAQQLADVGIDLEKRSFEWGTFFDDIKKGNFQVYGLTWVGVTDPDHLFYVYHSSSAPPSGANRGRYANSVLDRLLERARGTGVIEERRGLYREAQRILQEDAPCVSLWWADNIVVRTKRLRGFAATLGGEYTSLASASLDPEPVP